ncbi:hypothetical protein L1887_35013 [Cichorium endivia]|nr:hypothetical protein L1887_35013 [Cichorium endivia]
MDIQARFHGYIGTTVAEEILIGKDYEENNPTFACDWGDNEKFSRGIYGIHDLSNLLSLVDRHVSIETLAGKSLMIVLCIWKIYFILRECVSWWYAILDTENR